MIVNAVNSKTEIKQTSDMLTVLFNSLGKLVGRKGYIFSFEVAVVQRVAAGAV